MGTLATIGGKTIIGPASWTLSPGVAPAVSSFVVTKQDAEDLIGRSATSAPQVTLRIKSDVNETTYEGLYVLHNGPSEVPGTQRLVVADRRWRWVYPHFRRGLNVPRRIGVRRQQTPDAIETWPIGPELQYAPWSLIPGGVPWNADRLIAALAAAITAEDGANVVVKTRNLASIPIQNLELDGSLDACIQEGLRHIPGTNVTVRANGDVLFFDTTTDLEEAMIDGAGPPVMGSQIPADVNFSLIRPGVIRVLFTPRVELRFDYEDAGDGGTTSRGDDDLWMDNVLALPDYSTSVGGNTLPRGTWVTHEQAYSAWGNLPGIGAPITRRMLRLALIPANDLWNGTGLAGATDPQASWTSRIAESMRTFRSTFRINRRWMDRIRSIEPYRISTVDTTTGQRGPATVYSDYSYLYTMRSLLVEQASGRKLSYTLNVAGYPPGGTITSSTPGTAAVASIVDSDQGIISIDYLVDRFRLHEAALPSQVERDGENTTPGNLVASGAGGPTPDISDRTNSITMDSIGVGMASRCLTARHKLSVIVTAVPATPNDVAGLIAVDVLPGEVGFKERCSGPMMEIRIGPNVATVNIGWLDSQAERIRDLFTRGSARQRTIRSIQDLVLNYGDGDPQNGASVLGIAQAAALRVWDSMRDRTIGTVTVGHYGGGEIRGLVQGITTQIDGDGRVTTTISTPDRIAPLDLARYLPPSLTNLLKRILPGR